MLSRQRRRPQLRSLRRTPDLPRRQLQQSLFQMLEFQGHTIPMLPRARALLLGRLRSPVRLRAPWFLSHMHRSNRGWLLRCGLVLKLASCCHLIRVPPFQFTHSHGGLSSIRSEHPIRNLIPKLGMRSRLTWRLFADACSGVGMSMNRSSQESLAHGTWEST